MRPNEDEILAFWENVLREIPGLLAEGLVTLSVRAASGARVAPRRRRRPARRAAGARERCAALLARG